MKTSFCLAAVTFVAAALLATGCVDQYGRIVPPDPIGQAIFNALDPAVPVYQPREYVVAEPIPAGPPPGYYDVQPVAPVAYSNPYWVNGYWGWSNTSWSWVPGRWVQRPRYNAVWVGGRYYSHHGHHYWRSGYWR